MRRLAKTLKMFDNSNFPQSLDEEIFEAWLESGRQSKVGYNYLLIIWDEADAKYLPVYVEHRDQIDGYEKFKEATGRESLVAAYDLYSEGRVV